MTLFDAINPLYSISGFGVGLLVGLTGVGGGSLMTPLLVLLFGIHPATAVGTDLLYAAITKSSGTLVHGLRRTVEWRITGLLALGSIPATIATLFVLQRLGIFDSGSSALISKILGGALILTAISLLFRDRIVKASARHTEPEHASRTAALTVFTGMVLGVLVSASSVGAGALGVTVLLILYPRLPLVRLVGSDIAHAVPLTLIAGLGHWMIGSVDWSLLGSLLVGSIPGIAIGSYVSSRVSERMLRPLMAVILMILGAKLLA